MFPFVFFLSLLQCFVTHLKTETVVGSLGLLLRLLLLHLFSLFWGICSVLPSGGFTVWLFTRRCSLYLGCLGLWDPPTPFHGLGAGFPGLPFCKHRVCQSADRVSCPVGGCWLAVQSACDWAWGGYSLSSQQGNRPASCLRSAFWPEGATVWSCSGSLPVLGSAEGLQTEVPAL